MTRCPHCHRPRGTDPKQCPGEKTASCIGSKGGKTSKRTITPEQRAKMEEAKRKKKREREA